MKNVRDLIDIFGTDTTNKTLTPTVRSDVIEGTNVSWDLSLAIIDTQVKGLSDIE